MNPEPELDQINQTPPEVEDLIGAVIGDRYRVDSIIARGGWGCVVKARQLSLDRWVALKLLHAHLAWDHLKVARFKQEAQAASMLSHQNILTVRDYGYWAGRPYLVMDYLCGHTLADEIKANPNGLSLQRFYEVFCQVTRGIAAAHRADIVHRDLTPANIFIVDEGPEAGTAKVLDFGLAKFVSADGESLVSLTQTGASLGTPAYMSPEQCKGEKVDARSDIYALGCCMYEALAGKKVFEHDTVFGFMSAHVQQEPPTPISNSTTLPANLEGWILRCLEKEPASRPQSMDELADTLDALRNGKVVLLPGRKKRFHPKSKVAAVAIAFLLMVGAGLGLLLLARSSLFVPEWQKEYKQAAAEFQTQNFRGGIFHQRKAIELAKKENLPKWQMGELYYNLGTLYYQGRHWNAAHDAFMSAKEFFEKSGQPGYLASVYSYLTSIEFELGHNDKAIECAETRVELIRSKEQHNSKTLSDALQQLSEAYARVGNLKKMKEAISEALEIDEILNDQGRLYEALVRYGDLLDKLHRHDLAVEQFKKALAIMNEETTREKLEKAQKASREHKDPKDPVDPSI